jgi:hypothetical protein
MDTITQRSINSKEMRRVGSVAGELKGKLTVEGLKPKDIEKHLISLASNIEALVECMVGLEERINHIPTQPREPKIKNNGIPILAGKGSQELKKKLYRDLFEKSEITLKNMGTVILACPQEVTMGSFKTGFQKILEEAYPGVTIRTSALSGNRLQFTVDTGYTPNENS